ncbi:Fe2+-dependent dioxygenase [Betaproteobacteria bacterium SCN1]|jgi:PKHD-type hydroxylase|nr:Fe2+-dependent dioxygenase [Betaproteobacteria bacterium SCN1]MBN8759248.1 Fe2+-dependent dioxygenase [Thiobacillus sp.]ODU90205.1 MAG: Fe2+-dependent dioxygenase [Thiobacillus sp. SCN 65-179]OJW38358.1 MAG: Fe2+-dependent dioxygenase [Thiobacillus sp. 65-69]
MLLHIPDVLDATALARSDALLKQADWTDGRITAGSQAATVKNNLQLPETSPVAQQLRTLVLEALSRNPAFFSAALPKRIYPPLFNRYGGTANAFGNHVDNAVRTHPATAQHVRTDMSFTLFLNDPAEYDGGELVIEDGMGGRAIKLPAGHLILYPAYSVHRVEPVTRGARLACFSWLESMVREPQQRELLHELDMSIAALRSEHGETDAAVRLTSCYHNLMRMWATV